ncbi:hypothetical protein ABKN59_007951 [Abortiporus biennis]
MYPSLSDRGEASYLLGTTYSYDASHARAVLSLVIAGGLSGFAVWIMFVAVSIRSPTYQNTHVVAYFISLLMANALQAIGSTMNVKWVLDRAVEAGGYCDVQAGIKQAGNVGMALWSFVLAMHIFNLLFLRWKSTRIACYTTLGLGWLCVVSIVSVGPLAIQKEEIGPYFGPSGYWCWITHLYPAEQTWLEYFFEFLSAGLSFFLYVAILCRVRGNLIYSGSRWHFRYVPRGESWQFASSRDIIDTAMLRVARRMVWYPVAYTIFLLPVTIARFIEFGGEHVPFAATMFADTIFNLQGIANVLIFIFIKRFIPDTSTLPEFSTPREEVDLNAATAAGITPFILPPQPPPPSLPAHSQRPERSNEQHRREVDLEMGEGGQNSASLSRSDKVKVYFDSTIVIVVPRIIRESVFLSSSMGFWDL